MPKMTEKQVKEHLGKLVFQAKQIQQVSGFARELLRSHLKRIPNGKLYKYRNCSNRNFQLLKENCIWMAPASSFMDLFDCTVNIDLKQNSPKIRKWMNNSLPEYVYYIWKDALEDLGQECPLSCSDFVAGMKNCLDKNGDIIYDNYYDFAMEHSLVKSRTEYEEQMVLAAQLFSRVAEKSDEIVRMLSTEIDKQQIQTRETTLVYSMSDSYDNDGLWENYAQRYTGFCVGYSFERCLDIRTDIVQNLQYLLPVIYKRKRPIYDLVPVFDGVMKEHIYPNYADDWKKFLAVDMNMQLYYKRDTYSFEREWRFVMDNKGQSKQYFPFVSALYAGKDIKTGNLRRLCSIARKLKVPVYKQVLNRTNNGFEYEIVQEASL